MPLLAHPAALFSLLALPALLGIYFLYSRFRRREVSSVFLWLSLGRQTAGRGRVRAAMPPLSFWLESLALLCLSLAAVGLCWPAAQRLRPLVVVLDDSLSMQAVVGGSSARTRAETLLRRELRRCSRPRCGWPWPDAPCRSGRGCRCRTSAAPWRPGSAGP
jgi:hypothetical protein